MQVWFHNRNGVFNKMASTWTSPTSRNVSSLWACLLKGAKVPIDTSKLKSLATYRLNCFRRAGFYRNPISEITKFLQHYHPHRHRVYNLCAERTYNPDRLLCDVVHYPFDDHQVCLGGGARDLEAS
jgi:hypothetical protein